ncbi:MAG TPA: pilus assembly PilX N-terminal domain-containing protein [Sedimentisphaerales bacterium]|nr:pilus assembly PilX N-terminal domain-containing protein [Sedimentisphaerales bacterium]
MTPTKKVKIACRNRRASALIVSLMFVLIFSALAVSMMTLSSTNMQLASNHHNVNTALATAQSGQEVIRYWLSRVLFSSSTPQANYFSAIVSQIKSDLNANGITNVDLQNDGSIGAVMLDTTTGQRFDASIQINPSSPTILQTQVTGYSGDITRTIRTLYNIEPYIFPIFNYGLATKGPVNFPGNPTITAVNEAWEADIFIESSGSPIAMLSIGNLNFDGSVNVGDPNANVNFQAAVQIAGDFGQTAIDNHVSIGNDSPEFPTPDTERFRVYATGSPIVSSADPRLSAPGPTLTNVLIKGGVNPTFQGSVTINGVLFIEYPNKVTFSKNVALNGIMVANGLVKEADPASRRIDILGNFASGPYPSDPMFDAIRAEEGTSMLAPGFFVTFSGNFSTLEGVVAVSGVHFSGNVNAQIKGSIVNYSNSPTVIEGNAVMNFDRVGSVKIPAGFDLYRELDYSPTSYSESAL